MVLQRNLLMLAVLTAGALAGVWMAGAAPASPEATPTAQIATAPAAAPSPTPSPETTPAHDSASADEGASAAAQEGEITTAPALALEDFNLRVTGDTGSGIHEEWTIPVTAASFDALNVLVTIEDAGEIIDWTIQCVEAILRDAQGNEIARGTAQEQDGYLFTEDETVTVLEFRFADGDQARERAVGDWTLELHANDSNLAYNVIADVLY